MKICIVSDVLGEENNGTTIATMNLIRTLKEKNHDVKVICPITKYHEGEDGYYFVPTIKFPGFLQKIVEKNNVVIGKPNKKLFKSVMADCDLVYVMMPLFIGKKAAKFAKVKMKKPVIGAFHAQAENISSHFIGCMNSKIVNMHIYKDYYRKMYKYCDSVHYPTQFIRDIFEDACKHKTNGYVISNGVLSCFKKKSIEKPAELKDKKIILFTGRISKEKSHNVLIEAVAKSKYKDDIQLIFAGQGPRHDEVVKLSKKLLTNQPIISFYSREELIDIINYSDLYVHPAEVEIEAISCIEAICCGRVPVIANSPKCATKAFALDDRSLFEVNNPADLAKKIDYWFDNPEELKKMEAEYLKTSNQFDFETCMNKMEKMVIETKEKYDAKEEK